MIDRTLAAQNPVIDSTLPVQHPVIDGTLRVQSHIPLIQGKLETRCNHTLHFKAFLIWTRWFYLKFSLKQQSQLKDGLTYYLQVLSLSLSSEKLKFMLIEGSLQALRLV